MKIRPSLNVAFTAIDVTARVSLQKHSTVTSGALLGTLCLDCVELFMPSLKIMNYSLGDK